MESTKELIKELWQLWDSMAECGELSIGPKFSAEYKQLKARVEQNLNIHSVSGKQPSTKLIRAAAIAHCEKECTNPDYDKKYVVQDFIAGANWAISQAACDIGARAKSVCGEKPAHHWIETNDDNWKCSECGMLLRA